jgi:hypothetical protein
MKDITTIAGDKATAKIYALLNIAIVVIIIVVLVKIYKSFKAGSASIGNHMGNQVISVQTGVQAARVGAIRQIAQDVEKAITRYWITNKIMYVLDAPFVNAINKVYSAQEAQLLSQFYRENTGDSLKDILESSHVEDQYKRMVTFRVNLS